VKADPASGPGFGLVGTVVLGLVAALGSILWISTGLGCLVSGKPWPRLAAGAVATALLRFPAHLSEPRLAWPSTIRSELGGPIAFYLALVLVLAVAALLTAAVLRVRASTAGSGQTVRGLRSARWATRRELTSLWSGRRWSWRGRRQSTHRKQRLALGHQGTRILRAEERHALVVFGPPQSGKSAGIAIPALLEWEGPAVASSIKTDLYQATAGRRRELGEVLVFDPYGLSPARGTTWSPLRLASSWDEALSVALRMSAAAELDTSNVKGGSYWTAAAEQRLAPLLWAGSQTGGGIAAVVRWAYGQGDAELPRILHELIARAGDDRELADARAAYDAHVAFEALAGETRSSIESTVQMLLRAYRSPRVQSSARSCELTPERLLDGPNTLYLIGDSHRSRLLRPIFLALLQEIVDYAFHDATMRGGRLSQPLLLCLDELGNVAPLPNLAEVASTAPSHNIQLVSIFHDVAQAKSRYGEQAHTVINSHRARLLLPGVADLETLRYFSDLLGEQLYREREPDSHPLPPQRHPLSAPQELRQLGEGEALLVYGRLPPTKLRLRAYYGDRRLRKLAGVGEDGR
jgi:type IV secretion system protein VirD4